MDAVSDANKELQKAESQRQLYVAMTRARDMLIMSGTFDTTVKVSKADNWFNNLKKIFSSGETVQCEIIDDMELTTGSAYSATETVQVNDKIAAVIAPLAEYNRSSTFTATALQTYLRCPRQYYYQQIAGLPSVDMLAESSDSETQLPAYVTGIIVHKALECYNGDEDKAFKAAADEFAGGQYASAQSARDMLHNSLASSLYKNQPQAKQREVHFSLRMEDGLMLNGVIDCVFDDAGQLVIIDYKTGQPPESGEVKSGYAYQLALYKLAAEKLFGKAVGKCQLHFLQNLSVWQLPYDGDYLKEALALCHKLATMSDEQEFACNKTSCGNCPYSFMCPQE